MKRLGANTGVQSTFEWLRRRLTLGGALLLSWVFLSVMLNLRYPERWPRSSYLLPSLDVTTFLVGLALLGRLRMRIPRAGLGALAALLVVFRLFRIADGVQNYFLYRKLEIRAVFPLLPELWRLLLETVSPGKLALAVGLATLGALALGMLSYLALGIAQRALADRGTALAFTGAVALLAAVSLFAPPSGMPSVRLGLFGTSIFPRLITASDSFLHADEQRQAKLRRIRDAQQRLRRLPAGLVKLEGQNVLLFILEAYGETLLDRPLYRTRMVSTYRAIQERLERRGYHLASGVLSSPVYGGGSWLAHATVGTGTWTEDAEAYALLRASHPLSIAHVFRALGYRTVLAQPGTVRETPETEFYGFDRRYHASDFEYDGPRFGYARMPDQYVVDFVHRREVTQHPERLFLSVALVSSHAPWNQLPPLLDDWSRVRASGTYSRVAPVTFPVSWNDLSKAGPAYLASVRYDLEVLTQYLERFLHDGSLVILLGDHQPLPQATGYSQRRGVPVHLLSRRRELVEPFLHHGFAPGMLARPEEPLAGLDTFLPTLLECLSSPTREAGGR